jgi:hypothetical protein
MRFVRLLACLLAMTSVSASEPLKMLSTLAPDSPLNAQFNLFINTVFQRSNISYTLTYLPTKRAANEFITGKFAGDVARTDFMAQVYPEAIQVLPAYISNPYFAISRNLNIKKWESMQGLRIAYLRGNLIVETLLGAKATLNPVDQVDSCIKMVKAQRVDICILNAGSRPTTEFTEAKPALRMDQFDTVNIYIWLAPQYRTQAERLGKTISEMQKDGSLAVFQAALLNPPAPTRTQGQHDPR